MAKQETTPTSDAPAEDATTPRNSVGNETPEENAGGADQVQAAVDAETDRGYRGTKVDPTPDEHYSVAGVVAGLPTPETDPDQHARALHAAQLAGRFPKAE